MAGRQSDPNSTQDREPGPTTPRWVKAFGIVAIVVLLLIGFILFTGLGGPHGPQRHGPSSDGGGHGLHVGHEAGPAGTRGHTAAT
jgi:hypothetical protein